MLSEIQYLLELSDNAFVQLWRGIVGETPAIVVERDVMVGILLEMTCPERRAGIYAAASAMAARAGLQAPSCLRYSGVEAAAC